MWLLDVGEHEPQTEILQVLGHTRPGWVSEEHGLAGFGSQYTKLKGQEPLYSGLALGARDPASEARGTRHAGWNLA